MTAALCAAMAVIAGLHAYSLSKEDRRLKWITRFAWLALAVVVGITPSWHPATPAVLITALVAYTAVSIVMFLLGRATKRSAAPAHDHPEHLETPEG